MYVERVARFKQYNTHLVINKGDIVTVSIYDRYYIFNILVYERFISSYRITIGHANEFNNQILWTDKL